MYISICIHVYVCVVCVCVCVCVRMCVCACAYLRVCVCLWVCVCTWVRVCVRACVHVFVYLCCYCSRRACMRGGRSMLGGRSVSRCMQRTHGHTHFWNTCTDTHTFKTGRACMRGEACHVALNVHTDTHTFKIHAHTPSGTLLTHKSQKLASVAALIVCGSRVATSSAALCKCENQVRD